MSNDYGRGSNDGNRRGGNSGYRDPRKGGFQDRGHGGDRRGGSSFGGRSGQGAGKGFGDRGGRGGYSGRGGSGGQGKSYGDRSPRKFDDNRGPKRFNDNRGPKRFDRDDRGPKRFDRDDRGPKRFGGDRGYKPFGGHNDRRESAPQRERLHVDRGGTNRGLSRASSHEPRRGDSDLLKQTIERIAGKSFGAYRDIEGVYAFDGFELSILRVQRDPFAPPSKMTLRVPQEMAGFDEELFDQPWRKRALEDRILRGFCQALAKNPFDFADFIKGGAFSTSKPGPEVLTRSACSIDEGALEIRFEATLPARERSIATREFDDMLFKALPRIVRDSMLAVSYDEGELEHVVALADDQHAIREALAERGLVAFVADGAVLPRETGVSDRPMAGAVAFQSPESMRVSIDTPHSGEIAGMGIPRGVTLIVGGGYHGKSTLLKAIESGVYDHIAGDGREFVICDASAMKLRAEDGRSVRGTDISLFINNLPSGKDTTAFWTEDASGSTSQAASTAEALEAKSRVFLIDEDTSATNFMVREPLMQAVIASDGEPITPFVERLRDLYEKAGVSTILVAGSSGAFFSVADTIIQMKEYLPYDITKTVSNVCAKMGAIEVKRADGFKLPNADRLIASPQHPLMVKTASEARKDDAERREGRGPKGPERLRAKVLGGVDVRVGSLGSDMRFVEQLVDAEQTKTLACIVKNCLEKDLLARMSVKEVVDTIETEMAEGGLQAVSGTKQPECGMAMPRRQEIFACLNRLRPRD